jgi:hypothetical protein
MLKPVCFVWAAVCLAALGLVPGVKAEDKPAKGIRIDFASLPTTWNQKTLPVLTWTVEFTGTDETLSCDGCKVPQPDKGTATTLASVLGVHYFEKNGAVVQMEKGATNFTITGLKAKDGKVYPIKKVTFGSPNLIADELPKVTDQRPKE